MPATSLPRYRGPFKEEQADRLLWRAGFGPRPGQAARLASLGLDGAVKSLTRPKSRALTGPKPTDEKGRPLAPLDEWGHDHCWWLDRMVRSEAPLIERMTLVWHDWFATSGDGGGGPRLMIAQNRMLRRLALGKFDTLMTAVTRDPAMLLWLSGSANNKWTPNENYAREMLELFSLGAGRGAYTELDVRQMARAMSGWRNDWNQAGQPVRFRYDPEFHDTGVKRIFGHRGRFGWRDGVALAVAHPKHPEFFAGKLWSAFIPVPPPRRDLLALARLYRSSGHQIRPVLEAILRHPLLYDGPRMVKSPVTHVAGMLRAAGRGVSTEAWAWICNNAGQMLFYPPNVAGWDEARWLDTGRWQARIAAAAVLLDSHQLDPDKGPQGPSDPASLAGRALEFWGRPVLTPSSRAALLTHARACVASIDADWQQDAYPPLAENSLRLLTVATPGWVTS